MARKKAEVEEKLPAVREVSDVEPNYFEEYGRAASVGTNIRGKLLKFSKGEYLAGQENDEVAEGTELVAVVDSLLVGWVKWEDERPVDTRMCEVVKGEKPPKRSELGDDDESLWPIDDNSGKPRDPWQKANQLIFRPVDWSGDESDVYTFATQSVGGIGAVAKLSTYYGKEMRQRRGEYPVVSLQMGSYLHKDRKIGKVWFPVLEPTEEWVRDVPPKAIAAPKGNTSNNPKGKADSSPAKPKSGGRRAA
jgi:hypothetical protein